jgi:hypothetical protein
MRREMRPKQSLPKSRGLINVLLLALSLPIVWAQAGHREPSPMRVYRNAELGFRYRPPHEMRDKTGPSTAELEDQARHLHIESRLELLLSMSSGPDDRAVGWHSLTIVAYPREEYSQLDDTSAKAKMSFWVGGATGSDGESARSVVISGQPFSVFAFGVQVDGVKKASVVWTTIRKGKLLSFAFAANNPEQLKALTQTMKTLQFV